MNIGSELRKARMEAGLTQEQVSKKAKIHRVYLSEVERGEKSPSLEVFFRLCAAMQIRPSKLIAKIEKD